MRDRFLLEATAPARIRTPSLTPRYPWSAHVCEAASSLGPRHWMGAVIPLILSVPLAFSAPAASADLTLDAAVHNPQRSDKFVARDGARHPLEELAFFGVRRNRRSSRSGREAATGRRSLRLSFTTMAPITLLLRVRARATPRTRRLKLNAAFRAKIAADATTYGRSSRPCSASARRTSRRRVPRTSCLTFRNLHNWLEQGYAPEVFAAFYRALKPGGVLGIEDHRGQRDAPQDPKAADGYVRQDYAVALAEKAGFTFIGPPRSTPTRRTPTGRRAFGPCRQPSGSAIRTKPVCGHRGSGQFRAEVS